DASLIPFVLVPFASSNIILPQSAVDFISTLMGEVVNQSPDTTLTVNVSQMQVAAKVRRITGKMFFTFKASSTSPTA
ncbi:MAG: hypothetical protein QXF21_07120, partial [Thermoproteota archaeon]